MSHPLLQIRQACGPRGVASDRAHGVRRAGAPDTVGEQLRLRLGESFDSAFLASQLGCSEEAAERLQEFWLPREPRPLREQTLLVFARVLDLDFQTLRELLGCETETGLRRDNSAAAGMAAAAQEQLVDTDQAPARPAPTVIWRKRHGVSTSS